MYKLLVLIGFESSSIMKFEDFDVEKINNIVQKFIVEIFSKKNNLSDLLKDDAKS